VASAPDHKAIIDRDQELTYREFHERVTAAAGLLRRHGVVKGDVVSFQLPNWWEAFVIHFAAIRIGAVSNPIMAIMRERELGFMLDQAGSRILFVPETYRGFDHRKMAELLQHDLPRLAHVIAVRGPEDDASFARQLEEGPSDTQAAERHADDPVLLLFTSGTESDPKGAVHSHNTLGYEDRSIIEHFGLTSADVVFMPSPVAHITGVLYGFHLATFLSSTVVIQDRWDASVALETIERERCSFVLAATPFLQGLVDEAERTPRDTTSLRMFSCGGADVPPQLIRLATERLGCVAARVYGSTEFPTLCAGRSLDPLDRRAETDGRLIGAAEVRIADEDGRSVAVGEVGDVYVRGPEAFLGYLDKARTEAAVDADGWFATGDRARMDSDGYLAIAGRTKDIIVRGGENISAKEVEDLIFEHPDVKEVAIVAMSDPVMVEKACAVVVPVPGAVVDLDGLVAHLATKRIARQKLPERLEIVRELPKTPTGKVQKFRLREYVAQQIQAENERA
jgi:cyclohexanecarboxylate-CoA ligase